MTIYNRILLIAFLSWVGSVLIKAVINLIINKKFIWKLFFSDGGMPSNHSAAVTSTATAVALQCGMDSPVFAVSVILALIVMHDATGVRQETGKQAKVINNMVKLLDSMGRGELTPEETLKEFVGHTGRQVMVGALWGIVSALVLNAVLP